MVDGKRPLIIFFRFGTTLVILNPTMKAIYRIDEIENRWYRQDGHAIRDSERSQVSEKTALWVVPKE